MSHGHVRVPPDSTGKRLSAQHFMEIEYANLVGDLQLDDFVSLGILELGTISYVNETSASTGKILLRLYHDVLTSEVQVGHSLTASGNPPTGTFTVVDVIPYYTSNSSIVGGNNPTHSLFVDNKGAAFTRFAEGAPLFDAFGGQKVSQPNTIGVYEFSADGGNGLFSISTVGGATDTYDSSSSTVRLTCSNASGDSVIRTSNKYHYYWPGNSTTVLLSGALSDTGVVGNTRRLGFFDESNGPFFEMQNTTANVVLRSSTSGSVTEIRVPQSEWNVDKLDGTGLSRINASWDKAIVYWIDLQWLGAGRVRFGILGPDGSRIVAHEFRNAGQNIYPYMKSASLPVRAENFNTAPVGSNPQLRLTCLTVKCDGLVDYTYYRNTARHNEVTVSAANTPLISLAAPSQYMGAHNPVNIYAEEYNCFVKNGTVRLDFCWPITLTGATWDQDFGAAIVDIDATAATIDEDYWLYASYYLNPGPHNIDLRKFFENNDEGIISNADGTFYAWNVVATAVDGTPTVQGALTWKELR